MDGRLGYGKGDGLSLSRSIILCSVFSFFLWSKYNITNKYSKQAQATQPNKLP
tara:strand:- start:1039 stop:1197 length:159 start_codon:yes stop_codon:yes gene_type:complete